MRVPPRRRGCGATEQALDARTSGLDTHTQIGEGEALRLILRSAGYTSGIFFWRYVA